MTDRLDLQVVESATDLHDVKSHRLGDLFGLALRRNPKRAHLLVSTVLGKHVPASPSRVIGAGRALGERVAGHLGEAGIAGDAVVLGFAETATSLGHCVSDVLDALYLHTTRRDVPVPAGVGAFEEGHSHATTHLLLAEDPSSLAADGPLVLVDDELSTGSTAMNFITQLHAFHPREHYLIAALVDVRVEADRVRLAQFARDLRAQVHVVALAAGEVKLGDDVLDRGRLLVEEFGAMERAVPLPEPRGELVRLGAVWPAGVPDGGRHGFSSEHRARLEAALPELGSSLAQALAAAGVGSGEDVHVLGHEELMYLPLRLAETLEVRAGAPRVTFSSTTRSPVLAVEDSGYAVRNTLVFPAHDNPSDGSGTRYAYNLLGPGGSRRFRAVVLVVDDVADTPELGASGGLLDQLLQVTGTVVVMTVPSWLPGPPPLHGPDFGSYAPAEVSWLLTDLSGVELEAPTEIRERAVQSGEAHYAESLPIEYRPSVAYRRLYEEALAEGASRVAAAVGTVTELALLERGRNDELVLASLARAGTPVGVLMRRWLARFHGAAPAHYAVSIVRGRGIDLTAMRYLAREHDPAFVLFVDGWTGKGAIARELAAAVASVNETLNTGFSSELAVLTDPGRCVTLFGTRDDFLIPSACLNSTVSGLVSRTVLNRDLLGEHQFHGAKFYAELANEDVSGAFLDRIEEHFDDAHAAAVTEAERLLHTDRTPTWTGHEAVAKVAAEFGLGDINLVKPGVGETTRVLLRRVPWKVLVSADAGSDLAHVRVLAMEREVPLETVEGLPYSCIGLIRPETSSGVVA